MTTPTPIRSRAERFGEDASLASEVAAGGLSAVELGLVVLVGLLVCPPLAAAAFIVVVPLLVVALVLGLLVAVVSTPYVLVHRLRGHHGAGHLSLSAHRVRLAGRAMLDLAPHRIVADVQKAHSGR